MTSDPYSTDFSYKKYSLEQLDNWMHDVISSDDVTPQEIYDTIKNVVNQTRIYHKNQASSAYELLSLLNGHRPVVFDDEPTVCSSDDPSPECKKSWVDFWEETYYPEESEKDKYREYNLREAEYYNKRALLDAEYEKIKAAGGYEWTPEPVKDKVKTWRLPVQQGSVDGVDEYYIEFPNDLLEAADLKEGDKVEWVDMGDGSYCLKKV